MSGKSELMEGALTPAAPDDPPPAVALPAGGRRRRSWMPSRFGVALMLLLGVLVVLPVAYVFYGATRTSVMPGTASKFTLQHLSQVYATAPFLRTIAGTVALGVVVGALATIGGTFFAWVLSRTDLRGRSVYETFIMAPLFLSPFVGAIAWVTLAAPRSGMLNILARRYLGVEDHLIDVMTVGGMAAILAMYYLPYAFIFVNASLNNMNPELEEASYMCGVGRPTTAFRVTLRLVRPSMAASFFFIAVLTAGIFSVPAVLATGDSFLPLAVRLQRATGRFPSDYGLAAAIGTVIFLLTIVGVWAYRRSVRDSKRFVTITAKVGRPRLVQLSAKWQILISSVCIAFVLAAIVLPYAALIIVSLTPYAMTDLANLTLSWDNFTTVLTSTSVASALRVTAFVGIVAPTLCVLLGASTATYALSEKRRGRAVVDYLATVPIAVPGIVFATGMVWFYIRTPLYATVWLLVIAYVASYLPHSHRMVTNGLVQVDRSLQEASLMCGVSPVRTSMGITLPLLKPALYAAWLMSFIFTIREISAAIILYSSRSRVLSVLTWDFIAYGNVQQAAVVGVLQTAVLVGVVMFARVFLKIDLRSLR